MKKLNVLLVIILVLSVLSGILMVRRVGVLDEQINYQEEKLNYFYNYQHIRSWDETEINYPFLIAEHHELRADLMIIKENATYIEVMSFGVAAISLSLIFLININQRKTKNLLTTNAS
jgi:lipopolysaccharide biosynthesis protein